MSDRASSSEFHSTHVGAEPASGPDPVNRSLSLRKFLAYSALLAAFILIVYRDPLIYVYLFADEFEFFGDYEGFLREVITMGGFSGRPVQGAVIFFIKEGVFEGASGVQIVRIAAFLASTVALIASFWLLLRMGLSHVSAGLLTAFLWVQPAIAGFHAYFSILPYWVGLYCGIGSFAVFLANRDKPMSRREGLTHFVLFGIALCTFQATPFVVLPFAALFLLRDGSKALRLRTVYLVGILVGAAALYSVGFKILQEFFPTLGNYHLLLKLANETGLLKYWGPGYLAVFEFWNYPVPLQFAPGVKTSLLVAAAALFLMLAVVAMARDVARDRSQFLNWASAFVMLGLCFAPIFTSGGDARQHLAVAAVFCWILIAYHAFTVLIPPRHVPVMRICAVVMVLYAALGASFGLQRGITGPYGAFMQLAQHEFRQSAASDNAAIHVVLPTSGFERCLAEPCTGFFGRHLPGEWHLQRPEYYRFVAYTAGGSGTEAVRFTRPGDLGMPVDGEARIDWPAIARTTGVLAHD